jgi:molybdopterin/thiamine biosynthesis adenylyltransferase
MSGHNKAYLGADYSKLETAKVLVCGAGALGSNLVMALAQEGYKHLTVIDFDRIEQGNAYTQVYGLTDNGGLKVQVLKALIARKLRLAITDVNKRLDKDNAAKILAGHDLVIDTFDNWESRVLVRDTARTLGISCVHGGMSEQGYSEIVWDADFTPPEVQAVQRDLCEYPLAGPLVHVTSAMLQAVVTHYIVTGKKLRRSFTLRDMKLRDF